MDSFREHPSDFDLPPSTEAAGHSHDVDAAIGTDERRMHVRAYNYWVSLLEGRDFPSIEDLEPADVTDFATQQRSARFHLRTRQSGHPLYRDGHPRRVRPRRRHPDDRRRAQPLVAVAPHRSLYADHRQPRADRLRGRVREPARRDHLLSRHPDALLVGRRDDRFHLWSHQLEERQRRAAAEEQQLGAADLPVVEFQQSSGDDAEEQTHEPLELTEAVAEEPLELTKLLPTIRSS